MEPCTRPLSHTLGKGPWEPSTACIFSQPHPCLSATLNSPPKELMCMHHPAPHRVPPLLEPTPPRKQSSPQEPSLPCLSRPWATRSLQIQQPQHLFRWLLPVFTPASQ